MHTDACDVTLNVCLGKEFEGAGLTFCGLRGAGAGAERKLAYRHRHVKGRAIMHLGHHRHGADDIVSGERYNLIMWNKCAAPSARTHGARPGPSAHLPRTPTLLARARRSRHGAARGARHTDRPPSAAAAST